jgi:hypothetical protein
VSHGSGNIPGTMFEEFDNKSSQEGRGRRGVSALLSLGIFAALALIVGGAVTAHQVRKRRVEQEQQVEFANLHMARAPKPKALVKPVARKRSHAARPKVAALKSIPKERPDEAEGELAEADDTGAVDGIIEEKVKGSGPASAGSLPPPPPPKHEPVAAALEQEREEILAPRFLSGCRAPDVPSALLSNAATIRIDVTILVDSAGRVTSAKVLNPNPLIPDQSIIECAMAQLYEPAHLPDGTKVPYPVRRRFVFKPAQA